MSEQKGKVEYTKKYDLSNPEDVAEVERIAQEKLKKIQEKYPEWRDPEWKPTLKDLDVDTSDPLSVANTKAILDQMHRQRMAELKISQGEGKDVVTSDDTLAQRKLQTYEKFGKDDRFLQVKTQQELTDLITQKVNEATEKYKPAPTGSAPLNSQQMGTRTDLYHMKFDNPKQMVETLSKMAREGNVEAKSYLDSITARWIDAKKKNPQIPDPYFDPNAPENLPLMKKIGEFVPEGVTPQDPTEGTLGGIVEAWRQQDPRVRRAREEQKRNQ